MSAIPSPVFLIILSGARDSQREAVQAIVKAHSAEWWHQLPDLWIVQGHSHRYWADLFDPVLALSQTSLVVLNLPADPRQRLWAFRGKRPIGATDWLWEKYFGRAKPKKLARKLIKPPGTSA